MNSLLKSYREILHLRAASVQNDRPLYPANAGITLSPMSRTDSTTGQYAAGLLPQAHLAQQRQHLIMEHV